jgi:hypothetical protein
MGIEPVSQSAESTQAVDDRNWPEIRSELIVQCQGLRNFKHVVDLIDEADRVLAVKNRESAAKDRELAAKDVDYQKLLDQHNMLLYDIARVNTRQLLEKFSKAFQEYHSKTPSACTVDLAEKFTTTTFLLSHFCDCVAVEENYRKTVKDIFGQAESLKIHPQDTITKLSNAPRSLFKDISNDLHSVLVTLDGHIELSYSLVPEHRRFITAIAISSGFRVRYRSRDGSVHSVEEDIPSPSSSEEQISAL